MSDCIFCKIISGEIKQSIIYEDNKTMAFLDINPASPKGGHTLVVPKKHYKIITDISDTDMKAISLTIKKLSKALMKFSDGLNIIQNNNSVAGQYVMHVHFHLIPRFNNDGITISEKWVTKKYKDNKEMDEVSNKIKSLLKN